MVAHRAETGLARRLAQVARTFQEPDSIEGTLRVIVETAPGVVEAAEHAGITALRGDSTLESPAYTDDLVLRLDQAQNETGEGPCLTAAQRVEIVRIDDVDTEERWPKFAARAAELGVRSVISCGLSRDDGWRAALNMHSRLPGAFRGMSTQIASLYAQHANLALENAASIDSLRGAMNRRQSIGEATGVLMERHRLGSREAFGLLVQSSQRLNAKLGVVAEHVALTGRDPDKITAADLSREH